MSMSRKLAKVVAAAGLGVAIWAAVPGSPVNVVAGSSLNISAPNGSSLN
ncbi:MAG: hypothetical protein M3O55_06845 [Actinomycetota bacterium]|nr:hypothetical protein [Actinomycetota bacterium]